MKNILSVGYGTGIGMNETEDDRVEIWNMADHGDTHEFLRVCVCVLFFFFSLPPSGGLKLWKICQSIPNHSEVYKSKLYKGLKNPCFFIIFPVRWEFFYTISMVVDRSWGCLCNDKRWDEWLEIAHSIDINLRSNGVTLMHACCEWKFKRFNFEE